MARYTGLPERLRTAVLTRDGHRCRWCGRTNTGLNLHHIRYRRGEVDDVVDNLIALCRPHHEFVHGVRKSADGQTVQKELAQQILNELVATPGVTGISLLRTRQRAWQRSELCEHGNPPADCFRCFKTRHYVS